MDSRRRWLTSRSFLLGIWALLLSCLVVVLLKSQPPLRREPHTPAAEKPACVPRSKLASDGMLGVVLPQQAVELTARLDGRLERLLVREGEPVRAGAELAVLDTRELERQEAVAVAVLAAARAEEQRAGVQADEKKNWLQSAEQPAAGVLPAREVEQARFEYKMALADLEAARARTQQRQAELEQLRTRLADAHLRMPFDGVVTARYLSVGAMVHSGTPVLRVIQEAGTLVRFAIPEAHSGEVTQGMPVTLSLPGGAETLRATVDNISPEVDAASRMIFATATLEPLPQRSAITVGKVLRVRTESQQGLASGDPATCGW